MLFCFIEKIDLKNHCYDFGYIIIQADVIFFIP